MMSEVSVVSHRDVSQADLPLSVLLFYTAMSQNIALSKFAEKIGIGPLSLRQFISGKAQRPRGKTMELLAQALNMSEEEVRRRTTLPVTSAPRFNEWFQDKLSQNLSRAKLTKETRISDGALRNYLSGQTLPDTDQAQRLAKTLGVDTLELAKVLVADHIQRNGGETVDPPGSENGQTAQVGGVAVPQHGGAPVLAAGGEEQILALWRRLHPQGRRATLNYVATLLAEEG